MVPRLLLSVTLAGFNSLSAPLVIAADSDNLAGLYERKPSLAETMLATRAKYATWVAEQTPVRGPVTCGPWFVAEGESVAPERGVDLAAKDKSGKPLWTKRADVSVFADGDSATPKTVVLCLTLTAKKPVTLTAGFGGGDHLDVWLNGKVLLSKETSLPLYRYGCGTVTDGTHCDQVLLELPLVAGDNQLIVKLCQGSVSRHHRMQFFFSLTPNPVPGLWTEIRKDFPPATNHLLELAKPDWFETNGWLSATDTRFEQRMISNCAKGIADYDDDGQTAPVGSVAASSLGSCITAAELFAARRDLRKLRSAVEELARSFPRDYPGGDFLRRLDDLEKRLIAKATTCLAPGDETIGDLARLKREMLVKANPLLRDVELLLVKRYTYNSKHYYDDFQHISQWGGNLYVLSLGNGHLRKLVPQLDGGIFDSCDVSFDGRRIVFGYRRSKPEGFRIYEIGVDGKGLRQVMLPPADEDRRIAMHGKTSYGDGFYGLMGYQFWTDDVHPCYLPDGGFCFAS
ncbi:MAG: hypothetical protein NTY01_03715, partial [Verrucomicrobia bacterium]|nr:hypothetical protein [Verrucomicrobiota bacterium]